MTPKPPSPTKTTEPTWIYSAGHGDDCECGLSTKSLHRTLEEAEVKARELMVEYAWHTDEHKWIEVPWNASDPNTVKLWKLGNTHDIVGIIRWPLTPSPTPPAEGTERYSGDTFIDEDYWDCIPAPSAEGTPDPFHIRCNVCGNYAAICKHGLDEAKFAEAAKSSDRPAPSEETRGTCNQHDCHPYQLHMLAYNYRALESKVAELRATIERLEGERV